VAVPVKDGYALKALATPQHQENQPIPEHKSKEILYAIRY